MEILLTLLGSTVMWETNFATAALIYIILDGIFSNSAVQLFSWKYVTIKLSWVELSTRQASIRTTNLPITSSLIRNDLTFGILCDVAQHRFNLIQAIFHDFGHGGVNQPLGGPVVDPGFLWGGCGAPRQDLRAKPPAGSGGRVSGGGFGGRSPRKLSTFCDTTNNLIWNLVAGA